MIMLINGMVMITSGIADLVTLGKGALANHDWVNKVKTGASLEELDQEKVLRPNAKIKDFEWIEK